MKRLRLRLTIRRMMILVAVVAALLAWAIDQSRRGRPIVDFRYHVTVENEPFVNPVKVVKITHASVPSARHKGLTITMERVELEGGRSIEVECEGLCYQGYRELDLQFDPDGLVTIHARRKVWYCGNSVKHEPWVRIPLCRVNDYQNRRMLLGRSRLLASSVDYP